MESIVVTPPMASIVVTPMAAPLSAEFNKLTFSSLYIRRTGPGSREISMDGKSDMGKRYFSDFPIYDGPASDASLVARVQGVSIQAGDTHQIFTIVFENDRFKGSTLLTNGVITGGSDDWAIYGGTGVFAMASGVIKRNYLPDRTGGNSDELTMEVFCPVFGSSQQPKGSITKMGLWGGAGGWDHDITAPPKRLLSLTITTRSGSAVESIQFTYTDKAGEKHTAGPWGGSGGTSQTIDLDDAEYVKEVSGTYSLYGPYTVLTSFNLVTNNRTWGPWGTKNGTRFCITAPANSSIVGFYGRSGSLIDAIGVYVREF
ncbi:unnamed protein product [Miscanthus lutarioriparius]|uniref:Dirigent protein n=1 Tax=Miscanthus lutarioriparius TaxID=422564 RepID=A0A811SLY3_9POAL|nr:unnamed protein product [Miscanthus lutarioriparius]